MAFDFGSACLGHKGVLNALEAALHHFPQVVFRPFCEGPKGVEMPPVVWSSGDWQHAPVECLGGSPGRASDEGTLLPARLVLHCNNNINANICVALYSLGSIRDPLFLLGLIVACVTGRWVPSLLPPTCLAGGWGLDEA